MRTHGAVVGRRFRSVTKLTTKVRIGRGYLWGSFLIAAAALKTPTRNGYNAQGVNLNSTTNTNNNIYIQRTGIAGEKVCHGAEKKFLKKKKKKKGEIPRAFP